MAGEARALMSQLGTQMSSSTREWTIAQASATPFLFGDHDRERGAGTDVLGKSRMRGGAALNNEDWSEGNRPLALCKRAGPMDAPGNTGAIK
jgi:hypothetical protein